ncbi:MAG TPA: hypothetical protein VHY35_23870 [Stellaceae bacterium]|jgi:hypothetical protein|nr:hypothetical protein [Stellaceae bacterium]
MKRALLAAGAMLVLSAPAFADQVTTEKQTITRTTTVPESGSAMPSVIVAPTAPPADEAEVRPPAPMPTAVWMPGHWSWIPERQAYVWTQGRYGDPPHPHAAWLPGHFDQRPDGWVWLDGRWD